MKNSLTLFLAFFTFCLMPFTPPLSLALGKMTVTLPGGRTIETLVADNAGTRTAGLMGHSHLKPDEGMLFIFETAEPHMMWMKNMLISIDMVWLNEEKEIIEIIPSAPPCRRDPCAIYGPSTPSRYVLEISEGASSFFHLRKGMKLKFP